MDTIREGHLTFTSEEAQTVKENIARRRKQQQILGPHTPPADNEGPLIAPSSNNVSKPPEQVAFSPVWSTSIGNTLALPTQNYFLGPWFCFLQSGRTHLSRTAAAPVEQVPAHVITHEIGPSPAREQPAFDKRHHARTHWEYSDVRLAIAGSLLFTPEEIAPSSNGPLKPRIASCTRAEAIRRWNRTAHTSHGPLRPRG
jgi:hypothetical protein